MARSFSQEARSDSHKIGETRYRMSHIIPSGTIARTLLFAGVLLAITVLASQSFLPAFAQEEDDPNTITYEENSDHEVAVFTATDQDQGDTVTWTVSDTTNFDIDDSGVLTFKDDPPNYEMPSVSTTGDTLEARNTYPVTVTATDDYPTPASTSTTVMVKVTNVDETGTLTFNTLQPLEGRDLTATLMDPDGRVPVGDTIIAPIANYDLTTHATTTWKWARSMSASGPWTDIVATTTANSDLDSETRMVEKDDVGYHLRATATYTDGHGADKMLPVVSDNPVRKNLTNDAPVFQYLEGDTLPDDTEVGDDIADGDGVTRTVDENSAAGTAVGVPVKAYDDDGDVLTYTHGGTDVASFDIDRDTGQLKTKADLDHEDDAEYEVMVTATDPSGEVDTITVTINVIDVMEAPKLAEPDTTAGTGLTRKDLLESIAPETQTPAYSAAVSRYTAMDDDDEDDNGDDKSLTWTLDGPDEDVFELDVSGANNITANLSFKDTAAPDFEARSDKVYDVTVVVTDSDDMTAKRDVDVTIIDVDEAGTVTLNRERAEIEATITASLSDPDGRARSHSWRWSSSATSSLRTSASYKVNESDLGETLTVTVTYTDDHGSGKTATVDVAVIAEEDPNVVPEFQDDGGQPISTLTRTVAENVPADTPVVGGAVMAEDLGGFLIYELTSGSGSFKIGRTTGAITVGSAKLDFENSRYKTHRVTVRATDPSGDSDTVTVTINVTDVKEGPSAIGGPAEINFAENTPATTVLGTYTATDDEDRARNRQLTWSVSDTANFAIGNDARDRGRLTFRSSPDYEMPSVSTTGDTLEERNTYTVTVTATDNGTPTDPTDTSSTSTTVMVKVTNVDETGTLTFNTLQPLEGRDLTATLMDPDGRVPVGDTIIAPIANYDLTTHATTTWKWARSMSASGPWTDIVATTTANSDLDSETRMVEKDDVGYHLRATATYTDGHGADKMLPVVSDNPVRKNLTNDAPVFQYLEGDTLPDDTEVGDDIADGDGVTRTVDENSAAGTAVGVPVKAYDDDGDVLTYTHGGTDVASFDIDRDTGQLKTKADLDHEDDAEYEVMVTATDPSGEVDTITVTINVIDVMEAPKLAEPDTTAGTGLATKDHVEATTTSPTLLVSTYTAMDDDDDADNNATDLKKVTWSLSGVDSDKFDIATTTDDHTTANLSFKAASAPDFEDPTDSGENNVYNVTVKVTDSDKMTVSRGVTVMVTNDEEDGMVTLSNLVPQIGTPITASLTDPDGGVRGVTWQWFSCSSSDCTSGTSTIRAATSATYEADAAVRAGEYLQAVATYTDNARPKDNPATLDEDESQRKDTADNGISRNPVREAPGGNQPPVFEDQDDDTAGVQNTQTTIKVPENTASPEAVDSAITANDGNTDTLTYTLGGPDKALFTIDTTTDDGGVIGQIRVGEGTKLDYETRRTYSVTVTATDPYRASASISVTIQVTDVNEEPMISRRGLSISGPLSVSYAEDRTDAVATYRTAGAENGVTWGLSGADMSAFAIAGGVLSFNSQPDHENPADAGTDNVYNVTITAMSGEFSRERTVVVNVTNVDEEGMVALTYDRNQVRVGVAITAEEPVDPDGGVTSVEWQWETSSDGSTGWSNIATGGRSAAYTPVDGDVGNFLRATASYTDDQGPGKSASSNATPSVVLAASTEGTPGTVALSPTTQLTSGDSVTARLTDADNPANQVWLWQRSVDGSTSWTTISAATSASYTTTNADAGNYLRATVTYDDSSGTGQTAGPTATTDRVKLHTYDSNANGRIDRSEVIDAIRHYLFANSISREQVIEVIRLYLGL